MAYKYIGKDIYKQLEQVMNRLDETLSINKELNETIKNLNKTISELKEENKKLLNEIDRLKNQNNKNSTNSSKPSSTNITTPKKKTGANLYNYRIKTDKKIGGQLGHTGYNLNKKKVEELIKDKKVEVIEIKHKIKGNSKLDNVVKYKLGINIKPYVEKHVFIYNEDVNESLPKEFYTDVTYTNDIKTLSLELGTYNLISYDRLSDFFSVITNNVINISNGTLVNFLYDFSSKSKLTINNLENNILNNKINYTDETTAKFNKKIYLLEIIVMKKQLFIKFIKIKGIIQFWKITYFLDFVVE